MEPLGSWFVDGTLASHPGLGPCGVACGESEQHSGCLPKIRQLLS